MRNEPWVWPEVRDAGTSGAGAVPLRSAQVMGQQKKKKKIKKIDVTGPENLLFAGGSLHLSARRVYRLGQ